MDLIEHEAAASDECYFASWQQFLAERRETPRGRADLEWAEKAKTMEPIPPADRARIIAELVQDPFGDDVGGIDCVTWGAMTYAESDRIVRHVWERERREAEALATKHLVSADDLGSLGAVEWLVDNAIPSAGITVLYGAPASYKSFAALDLGLSVAAGIPWAHRRTTQGEVIYAALEGARGSLQGSRRGRRPTGSRTSARAGSGRRRSTCSTTAASGSSRTSSRRGVPRSWCSTREAGASPAGTRTPARP